MSKQSISLLNLSVTATGTVSKYRFVTHAGAQAGAGVRALGIAANDAVSGDVFGVDVIGTAVLETAGAIAVGGQIESDASGKGLAKDTGVALAVALQASTGAGEFIEVLLIQN